MTEETQSFPSEEEQMEEVTTFFTKVANERVQEAFPGFPKITVFPVNTDGEWSVGVESDTSNPNFDEEFVNNIMSDVEAWVSTTFTKIRRDDSDPIPPELLEKFNEALGPLGIALAEDLNPLIQEAYPDFPSVEIIMAPGDMPGDVAIDVQVQDAETQDPELMGEVLTRVNEWLKGTMSKMATPEGVDGHPPTPF